VDASVVGANVAGSIPFGILLCIPLIMFEVTSKFPELKNPRVLIRASADITLVSNPPQL
jgi:hypothetical protein